MDDLDRRIVNELQGGLPLVERPYAAAAERLGTTETGLVARLSRLLAEGVLTRFGPLYNADRMGGAFTLCAMQVPVAEFDRVAAVVNAFPEVAHNYERDHRLNMWFVLATDTPEGIPRAITRIEAATGLEVLSFPKEEEFFVELRLTA